MFTFWMVFGPSVPLLPAHGSVSLQRLKVWWNLFIKVLGGGGCDALEVHWAPNSVNLFTESAYN